MTVTFPKREMNYRMSEDCEGEGEDDVRRR